MSGNKDQFSLDRAASMERWGATRKSLFVLLLLFLFSGTVFAPILIPLPTPQDSPQVRRALAGREELKGIAAEYGELMQTRLCTLTAAEVDRIFGPQVSGPSDRVPPIYLSGGLAMPGMRPSLTADRTHVDLHALGDMGYAEFWYGFDGERIGFVVLYHHAGRVAGALRRAFVPLQSTNDFPARLEWDLQQFQDIKKWLDEHLPKITDLGMVELSNHTQTRVRLETGEDCFVGGGPSGDGKFYVSVGANSLGAREGDKSLAMREISRPDQTVVFSVAGKFYRVTPKFRVVDLGVVEAAYDVPSRLDVGTNQECLITVTQIDNFGAWIYFDFHSRDSSPERQARPSSSQHRTFLHDFARPVVFSHENRFYSFTLRIK